MEQLREWLKTITALVIILGVLETVLPESGGIKKFAKLVFGLALMAAILQPVLLIVTLDWAAALPLPEAGHGEHDWLAAAERLQAKGAAPLLAAASHAAARQLEGLLLALEGVEDIEVQLTPASDGIEEVTVKVRGDANLGPRIQKIAAHYFHIPEAQVMVIAASRGEPGE